MKREVHKVVQVQSATNLFLCPYVVFVSFFSGNDRNHLVDFIHPYTYVQPSKQACRQADKKPFAWLLTVSYRRTLWLLTWFHRNTFFCG